MDIHVRVVEDSFDSARYELATIYEPFHRDAWSSGESAFFSAPGTEPAVEIALTVVGCIDDFHHGEAWDRIAADPALIERYNELKRQHEDAERSEYDGAKRVFFYESF